MALFEVSRCNPGFVTFVTTEKSLATSMEPRSSNRDLVPSSDQGPVSSSCTDVQSTILGLGKQCRYARRCEPAYSYHHKSTRPQNHRQSIVQLHFQPTTFTIRLPSWRFSKQRYLFIPHLMSSPPKQGNSVASYPRMRIRVEDVYTNSKSR